MAEGVSLARVSAYMESVPSTSPSHAEGIRFSLIMDITVQGTMPRYSSIEVQHWTAEGVSLARVSAYMESVPSTSTSHAEGIRFSLIMDITVQGTMPRYSSIEVQHWTAETVSSLAFIQ